MNLAGDYLFEGPQDIVWEAIQDPNVLGSIMPGGEGVEEVGENEYAAKLKIKVGPVQGKFKGNIKLANIDAPHSYDIEVDGKGAPGFVKASGSLNLIGEGEQTLMTYTGQARVGGKIASVGQRLLDASTKAIINQSLEALNEYIKVQVQRRAQADSAEILAVAEVVAEIEAEELIEELIEDEIIAEVAVAADEESAELDTEPVTPQPEKYQAPPPRMPEYQPPSQTQLALSVFGEIFDDLVPKGAQPILISFVTTIVTLFIFRLFSRKK